MKLLLVFIIASGGTSMYPLAQGRPDASKIDYRLVQSMRQEQTDNIFVRFYEKTDGVLQSINDIRFETRVERLDALHNGLRTLALRVQNNVLSYIQGKFESKSLWITNQVYIKDATMDLVITLASMPEVEGITQEEIILLDTIVEGPVIRGRQNGPEWGVQKIQAPEAYEVIKGMGIKASEVIISTIDTGARHTHEALRDNWLGEYGWFDPYDNNELPMDIQGHGTHTTGTICGKGGIGVYPDAKWTSCRGCATSSCSQSALTECGQFIVCPTYPDGSRHDCSKAPHLVSNSWGGGRGATWFDPVIAALHTARIIPLFSNGNSGPSCNTANSPGDNVGVIGVGSTTIDDGISSFSSVGPTIDGRMKPDISAPGSNVLSAYNTADDAYRALSGSSMACPHAAGLTAILFAANPNLVFANVTWHMRAGTETELVTERKVCLGVPDNVFPNHHHGHGRINALKSLTGLFNGRY